MTSPYLHVYPQEQWHSEALLIGNREALLALRHAIDCALDHETGGLTPFVNDGEGYDLAVVCADQKTIDSLTVPYTDELASKDNSETAVPPYALPIVLEAFRKLRK